MSEQRANPRIWWRDHLSRGPGSARPHWLVGARWLALWFPVGLIIWFGWVRRWACDDAFINYRIVRQLQGGNGPVFNAGDRVEAGTSPAWILVLAVADVLLPLALEWIAAVLSIAATAAGVGLAIAGGRRLWGTSPRWLLPVGALVYASVPAAWDFATSGLETGLGVFWVGLSWWVLVRRVGSGTGAGRVGSGTAAGRVRLSRTLCLLLGVGPFVRPDFAVFAGCFGLAALWAVRTDRREVLRGAAWMLLLPVGGTLLRMAYFGLPVPNTAVAKEAAKPSWQRGWWYLLDLVQPYALWLPMLLVVGVFLLPLLRRTAPGDVAGVRPLVVAALTGGVLHGFYIVRLGGDFMHGRMLLPTMFVVLLPVAVAPMPGWRPLAYGALAAWAVVAAVTLRTPQSTEGAQGREPGVGDAISISTNIHDERVVFRRLSGRRNPVTLEHFVGSIWYQGGRATREFLDGGGTGLLLDTESAGRIEPIPLNSATAARTRAVVYVGALGMYAYRLPKDVWVLDRFGLSNPLSAHIRLSGRGKPGHEKSLAVEWIVAAYAEPGAPLPAWVLPSDVDQARRALGCGPLADLIAAQQGRLGIGRIVDNLTGSLALWRFRMPGSPAAAAAQLCD